MPHPCLLHASSIAHAATDRSRHTATEEMRIEPIASPEPDEQGGGGGVGSVVLLSATVV